jgi:hypothetical protein
MASLFTLHFSFVALSAHSAVLLFFQAEAVVAYPSAADGAMVKMHTGVQIGLFKSKPVFVCPEHLPRFFIFNDGSVHAQKGRDFAFPFLVALSAVKTERKMPRIRVIA